MKYLNKYQEYIANTNNWNDNVIDYLQGGNENLYGTILSIKKGWRNGEITKDDFYSILFFFDHTTGRIERFLVNRGVKKDVEFRRSHENLDPFLQFDHLNEEKTKVIRPIYNTNHNIPDYYRTNNLVDGKLNKKFFNIFLFELTRDYLISGVTYKVPNMNLILKWTDPNMRMEGSDIKTIGSGEPIKTLYNVPEWLKVYLTKTKKASVINMENKQKKIYVPKNFYAKDLSDGLDSYGYNFEISNSNNMPLVIKDFKNVLNSKTYNTLENLNLSVEKFNFIIAKKIHDINLGIKNNKQYDYSEELFTYKMMKKI